MLKRTKRTKKRLSSKCCKLREFANFAKVEQGVQQAQNLEKEERTKRRKAFKSLPFHELIDTFQRQIVLPNSCSMQKPQYSTISPTCFKLQGDLPTRLMVYALSRLFLQGLWEFSHASYFSSKHHYYRGHLQVLEEHSSMPFRYTYSRLGRILGLIQ